MVWVLRDERSVCTVVLVCWKHISPVQFCYIIYYNIHRLSRFQQQNMLLSLNYNIPLQKQIKEQCQEMLRTSQGSLYEISATECRATISIPPTSRHLLLALLRQRVRSCGGSLQKDVSFWVMPISSLANPCRRCYRTVDDDGWCYNSRDITVFMFSICTAVYGPLRGHLQSLVQRHCHWPNGETQTHSTQGSEAKMCFENRQERSSNP